MNRIKDIEFEDYCLLFQASFLFGHCSNFFLLFFLLFVFLSFLPMLLFSRSLCFFFSVSLFHPKEWTLSFSTSALPNPPKSQIKSHLQEEKIFTLEENLTPITPQSISITKTLLLTHRLVHSLQKAKYIRFVLIFGWESLA